MRLPRLDWVLMVAVLALLTLGTLLVWSATAHRTDLTDGDSTAFLRKQLVNVVIGLVLLALVTVTDHRWVRIVAPLLYLASVAGLILVLTMGSTVNGSQSWLRFGGLSVQPSELAKLAVVVGMALVLAERSEGRRRPYVGAVDVSRAGGLRQRSVLGRAARAKEPMKSGTASSGRLRAVKEALDGGMAGERGGEQRRPWVRRWM